MHDINTLMNKPGKWLQANLEPEVRTSAGEKLNWLEFQLDRSTKEENKGGAFGAKILCGGGADLGVADRATLAQYLDPSWLPTRD